MASGSDFYREKTKLTASKLAKLARFALLLRKKVRRGVRITGEEDVKLRVLTMETTDLLATISSGKY